MTTKFMRNVGIIGSGIYLPEKKVRNTEIEEMLGLGSDFIESRTGIKERRWSNEQETVEYMASQAAINAMRDAKKNKVDRLILARDLIATRRAYSIGLKVMRELEKSGIDVSDCASLDICNYCPGFVNGLNIAQLMVSSGQSENSLVVASTDYTDMINTNKDFNAQFRDSFDIESDYIVQYSLGGGGRFQPPALNAFLWGCGAGAVVVGETDKNNILGFKTRSSRKLKFDSYGIGESKDGKSFCSLDGRAIYRYAQTEVPTFIDDFLEDLGLTQEDISILIPHQPNPRILKDLSKRLRIPEEKVLVSCDYLGNMIAASVPITYHLSRKSGKINASDKVMMCSFGDSYLTTSGIVFEENR
ncbi:ketoacyl-ACP synthase III [Candidatus Pacearchaeota archaeon]|nr:ketoacyl-ACP synthase III [Candidatus Pacearchaeota archaeon]